MKTLQKVTLAIALITLFASCRSGTDIKQVLSKSDTINIMKGFTTNIEKATLEKNSFRKVLYTAKYSQLVLMSLQPKEEIGMETHEKMISFFVLKVDMVNVLLMVMNMRLLLEMPLLYLPAQNITSLIHQIQER
jgi:hypothetical protein